MFRGSLSDRVRRLEKKACCSKIYFYDDFDSFPEKGRANVLYVDKENKEFYTWNGSDYIDFTEIDWGNIPTDESLYYDETVPELRSNIGQATQTFVWTSGNQMFTLTEEPIFISYVSVNGQIIEDTVQWTVDASNKTITITDALDPNDRILINYKFIITS